MQYPKKLKRTREYSKIRLFHLKKKNSTCLQPIKQNDTLRCNSMMIRIKNEEAMLRNANLRFVRTQPAELEMVVKIEEEL